MFSYNGEPLRIVVETVPHEVVRNLEEADDRLKQRISGLNNQLFNTIEVLGEIKRDLAIIKSECEKCGHACADPRNRKKR